MRIHSFLFDSQMLCNLSYEIPIFQINVCMLPGALQLCLLFLKMKFLAFLLIWMTEMFTAKGVDRTRKERSHTLCYIGSSSSTNFVPVFNSFEQKRCTNSPFSNGNTTAQYRCGLISYHAEYMGVTTIVQQGVCVPSSQCSSLICRTVRQMLPNFDISLCKASCCRKNLCNHPRNLQRDQAQPKTCPTNLCENGGECFQKTLRNGKVITKCKCQLGYTGKYCEEKSSLSCYVGIKSSSLERMGNTFTPQPTSCNINEMCMLTKMTSHFNRRKIHLESARCVPRHICAELSCDTRSAEKQGQQVTFCEASCCDTNFCNRLEDEVYSDLLLPFNVASPTSQTPATSTFPSPVTLDSSTAGSTCLPNLLRLRSKPGRNIFCDNKACIGSTCTVQCTAGYLLIGPSIFRCQNNRKWDKARISQCEPTSYTNDMCPRKNKLLTMFKRRCPPSCSNQQCSRGTACRCDGACGMTCVSPEITCPSGFLSKQQLGKRTICSNGTRVGSVCFATCLRGYRLVGPLKRICQSNGLWDTRISLCLPVLTTSKANVTTTCLQRRVFHDQCCQFKSYNSTTHICCDGKLLKNLPNAKCCGTAIITRRRQGCCNKLTYHSGLFMCCGANVRLRTADYRCCNDNDTYDPKSYQCVLKDNKYVLQPVKAK